MILPYALKFDNVAARELEQLPKDINLRIWSKLQEAKLKPFHYFSRLKGRPDYKLRAGDYRVIANINQNGRVIEIIKVGHRRNVYKD